ncbi:MAG: orotidine-5'-phosphate decarboxylase [Firmicutes bacterium]|nr:orotidine-5'-phosphate decarboxylase [Bacillota bacterium]
MIDALIEKVRQLKNPSVIGLDTAFEYLPENMRKNANSLKGAAEAILEFNLNIIEKTYKLVPAVKVQVAYYEMYGVHGLRAFEETLRAAKAKGLVTIADVKRNDIGATAACYSKAYLGRTLVGDREFAAFESDFITVNGYLGGDGIKPFLEDAKKYDKGFFVLAKTSNPSSGEIQDLPIAHLSESKSDTPSLAAKVIYQKGAPSLAAKVIYQAMGQLIEKWGEDNIGSFGYSRVGAVVGATHPKEAEILREAMPHTLFLVPGYGAQGAGSAEIKPCFDGRGLGAVVNSSRGIICAYKTDRYKGMDYASAAAAATVDMREDIVKVIDIL